MSHALPRTPDPIAGGWLTGEHRGAPDAAAMARLFPGDGEMAALCRGCDWAATPLGPVGGWSHGLRTTVATLLASRHPMFLWWGPELVQIYNDAYRPSLAGGGRHPRALGARGKEFWTDIWEIIGPQIDGVMTRGESTWHVDQLVPIERNRRIEEVYWTYGYSPVLDDDGRIAGTLVVCQETTDRVLAARRQRTLHALAALRVQPSAVDTAAQATRRLASDDHDVPFALCFLSREASGAPRAASAASWQLACAAGVEEGSALRDPARWSLDVADGARQLRVVDLDDAATRGARNPWPEPLRAAAAVPIVDSGGAAVLGTLVVGLSPRLPWDAAYEDFVRAASRDLAAHLAARLAESERDHLHGALQVERARLEYVFRQAPAFLAVLRGPEHVFELVNDAYYQLVGHRPLIGRPVFEALSEARGQGFEEWLDGVYATGVPFVGRALSLQVQRTPDAAPEQRFIDLTYMPYVEGDGTRSGIIAHGTDVTEQVQARLEVERLLALSERSRGALEEANAQLAEQAAALDMANDALRASEAQLRAFLDQAPDAMFTSDHEGRYIDVNHAACAMLGYTREQLLARTVGEVLAEVEQPRLVALVQRLRAEPGRQEWGDYLLRRADGSLVPTECSTTILPDGRWVAIAHDISERRVQEAEREQLLHEAQAARATAEAANRAKAEFLATMSHELRTPLNAIGGYAELIELGIHGPVSEAQHEALARIQTSQRHLLGLINQVLNYTRVEAGAVRYALQAVPVREALAAAETLVAPQVRSKGLTLETADCDDEVEVVADPDKLQQILLNLLTNATKFTETGGRIATRCEVRERVVAVHVSDTGRGIPPDRLDSVFEPFVQVDAGFTRTSEGVGLGLAISRDLARGMGGDLTAESAPGVGSTFVLVLPRAERA